MSRNIGFASGKWLTIAIFLVAVPPPSLCAAQTLAVTGQGALGVGVYICPCHHSLTSSVMRSPPPAAPIFNESIEVDPATLLPGHDIDESLGFQRH